MRIKTFTLGCIIAGVLNLTAADWPQWHGPTRDAHAGAGETLPDKLPADLKPDWKISIGGGFSSSVVVGDKLVFMDGDGSQEAAHCLDAKTGHELWKQVIAPEFSDEWGHGTRSTPIIDGSRVYVTSCNGEFRCLDMSSGKVVWGVSFEKDFGVKFLGSKANEGTASRRGNNGSPAIDGKVIFVPVGSTDGASVVAFDKEKGTILWKAGNDEAAYSSPMVVDLAGVRQAIYLSAEGLNGFRRGDGKLLWRVPIVTGAKRHACTPVVVGDNIVMNSYTYGMASFLVTKNGEDFSVKEAWRNKDVKINLATPVLVGGFLYSHGPNKNYVCVDASNGQVQWTQAGFGEQVSHTTAFGDKLAVTTDAGQLIVIKANPERYEELSRAQVCGKTWSFPTWANGKLYIRDNRELACFPMAGAGK